MLISDLGSELDYNWCEICIKHRGGYCDACGKPFAEAERTYRSASVHYHPYQFGDTAGNMAINKVLCVDCYRIDYLRKYPNADQPDLPDVGIDVNYHKGQKRTAAVLAFLDNYVKGPNDIILIQAFVKFCRQDGLTLQTLQRVLDREAIKEEKMSLEEEKQLNEIMKNPGSQKGSNKPHL